MDMTIANGGNIFGQASWFSCPCWNIFPKLTNTAHIELKEPKN
jgi:hypothetical protein